MKKIGLFIAILLATTLQAETLVQTLKGTLKGTDSSRTHPVELYKGEYHYVLTLTGSKKAKARLRIKKKEASGVFTKLVDVKKLKNKKTHKGTFSIEIKRPPVPRKTNFIVSKKVGPKKISYILEIYKK